MVARKSVAALIVLLVIIVGTAFAAPLRPAAGFGDSKIYDRNYKSVKGPSELSDGYVVMTGDSILVLENTDTRVEIEPHSIAVIVSLGVNPEFYLLDGKAEFSSKVGFTVRTTVTSYKAEATTTIYVITEESEETAYVESKSAVASNLITGNVTTIVAGKYIDNAKNGFKPVGKTLQEYWVRTIVMPQPKVYSETFSYNGLTVTIEATSGKARITYPSFITEEEVSGAFAAAAQAYPELTKGVTYEFGEKGTIYVNYPAEYGEDEFNLVADMMRKDLPVYIDTLLAYYAAQEKAAQLAAIKPLVKEFIYRGFDATVTAYVGEGYVTYPPYVTDEELGACAAALVQLHPAEFSAIRYSVQGPGVAEISYPETYGEAEFKLLTDIVDNELRAYIDYVWVKETPETAPAVIAEVKPETAETTPTEKTPIETAPRPEEPVTEPVEEKKSDFRFGMALGVIYGFSNGDDTFSAPQFLKHRIGVFKKNAIVIADPYIAYKNFNFGVHLTFGLKDGKFVGPFKFDTDHGITGKVGSIMHFISVLSYKTDDDSFFIGATRRNTELDFRSPIYEPFKLGYDKDDRLLLSTKVQAGGFAFKAFVEDLEFRNKIDGRSDYAGLRASYTFKKFDIGISAAADYKNGFKNMTFYPGADIIVPLEFRGQTLEISAQVAAQIASGKIQAVLAKAYVDTVTKDWLTLGLGVAFNYKSHINEIMNDGPCDVIEQFKGNSLDVTLRAGIEAGPLSFLAKMTMPFSFVKGSKLAYNTVRTRNGNIESITADTMDIQIQLTFGKFKFNAGMIYNGFSGKAAALAKALIKGTDRRSALVAMIDPEYSTLYANAIFGTQIGSVSLSLFLRADVMRVKGSLVVPVSTGLVVSF